MELRRIFEAIEALVSNPAGADGSTSEEEALKSRLKANISSYKSLLSDPRYDELSVLLDRCRPTTTTTTTQCLKGHPTLELYREFTTEAVSLLVLLDAQLRALHREDQESTAMLKPGHAPPASRALLSVSDSKLLCTLLEFAVSLGVYPYLFPGVDILVTRRLRHARYIAKATTFPCGAAERILCSSLSVLVDCSSNTVIGPVVITRHLSDILAGLIQMCHAPKSMDSIDPHGKPSTPSGGLDENGEKQESISSPAGNVGSDQVVGSVKDECLRMLQGVVKRTYKPLLVQELLALQSIIRSGWSGGRRRAPGKGKPLTTKGKPQGVDLTWLDGVCGRMLSEVVMGRHGVQHVISGVLQVATGNSVLCVSACDQWDPAGRHR